MTTPTASEVRTLVQAVLDQLDLHASPQQVPRPAPDPAADPVPDSAPERSTTGEATSAPATNTSPTPPVSAGPGDIDVHDPTPAEARGRPHVAHPMNEAGLHNLVSSTTARIGVGRAGPRPRTADLLLFQADHAVTQDAIFGEVPTGLLEKLDMFVVSTRAQDEEEYLLRPDLGRLLDDEGRRVVEERCTKNPQVQVVVGDGLSAAAVTNNLEKIYPVIEQGVRSAGLSLGTPFFVRRCRVGVMNDLNAIIGADMVVLLIGERPGLGVADALSVYSGWRPEPGKSDAQRDVVCMITEHGGTNPLEAGAFVVEHVKNVIAHQASGIELRLKLQGGDG